MVTLVSLHTHHSNEPHICNISDFPQQGLLTINIEVELKQATEEDLHFIESLLKSNGLPYEDIAAKVDCLFKGFSNEELIGIGGVEIYGDYGLLRSLVTMESIRGKGYGTVLCAKLLEYAKAKGVSEFYLLTTTADAFFEKVGFERFDRTLAPNAIQNTSEFADLCPSTAVFMRLKTR